MTNATLNKYIREIDAILAKDYEYETPDIPRSREFTKVFRKMISEMIKKKGWILSAPASPQWCYASGFINSAKGQLVYFSTEDYRYSRDWRDNILVRSAASEKDFHGGQNNYTNLNEFVEDINNLFNKGGF